MSVIIPAAAGICTIALGWALWMYRRERAKIAQFEAALWPRPGGEPAKAAAFDPACLEGIPAVAARYLRYSIGEGRPLARAVRLTMAGKIRFARNRAPATFRAVELLHADKGFLWEARTGGALPIRGFDRYFQGIGEMSWRLLGLLPLVRTHDANIRRSARERFVMERVLAPASLLPGEDTEWRAVDGDTVQLRIRQGEQWHEVQLEVAENGAPRQLTMQRWGNFETGGNTWQRIPYAARFEGAYHAAGYTLPERIRVSWWAGTERELEVVNFKISSAEFRPL